MPTTPATAETASSAATATKADATDDRRYLVPGVVTHRVLNPIITGLVKLGLGPGGARQLQVRGRHSGEWRTVPVNPLDLDGRTYLVAPRGNTEWVRNLRVAREGRLRSGRRAEDFTTVEVANADKAPIIRTYLERWSAATGRFFEGLTAESSDEELTAAAGDFPVFQITVAPASR